MALAAEEFLEILNRRAQSTPERVLYQLVDDGGSVRLSFAGLADRVRRLGSALNRAGLGAGTRIAVCMENRPAWPVAYLAAWYADGTVVPIDPALEPHAIRRVLDHAGARVCLTSNALAAKVASATAELQRPPILLNVDSDGDRSWDGEPSGAGVAIVPDAGEGESWDAFVAEHGGEEQWSPAPPGDNSGTIMYTSGTTGTPKGVMLSREALAENIRSGLSRIGLAASDHVLGVLPLFHALPLMANCLGPLFCGARVTFLAELNPDKIIAAFRRYEITAFACVPLFYYRFHDRVMKRMSLLPPTRRRVARLLLRLNRFARHRLGINLGRRLFAAAHEPFGEHLRLFVTGGAKFNPRIYADFLDLGFPLVQGYGLTEGSAVLAAHSLDQIRSDTVGLPIDGVEIRIENPNDEGIGEILARTPSEMRGYYRNQEASSEVQQGGWLRTGDLGRVQSDGQLQVTGRAKDMIVLASGKNIYPEELEAFYSQSEAVDEMCILGIDDPARQGAERLHAIVVADLVALRERGQVNVREMVKWELESLGLQLPGPQRVSSLEIRSEPLPRTTTRKIKRFELKRDILERGGVPPSGATAASVERIRAERIDEPAWAHNIRAIVSRHAKVEGVVRAQHLDLDLGLESLDRIELQAEIEEVFEIDLPQEAAGHVQTVGDLLDWVGEHLDDTSTAGDGSGDRWARVLSDTPPDIEPYLARRPVREAMLGVLFGLVRLVLRMRGFKIEGASNLPSEAPFIIAPNHFSFVDPFVLAMSLPSRVWHRVFFVGYSEYFEGRVLGYVSRLLRTIPIDQNRHLERAMQAAAEGLRRDLVLVIFPEGGRSSDGTVKEFRRGTGILARHLEVPVIPVGMWGTFEMWPRDGRPRPHPLAVRYGKALHIPRSASRAHEDAFMHSLRDQVIELVGVAKGLYNRKNRGAPPTVPPPRS